MLPCFISQPLKAQPAWENRSREVRNRFVGGYMWQPINPAGVKPGSAIPAMSKAGHPQADSLRILVILAQFSDVAFFYDSTSFSRMLYAEGYSENGAVGSASEYFSDQLHRPVAIELFGPVTVQQAREFYGRNTKERKDEHAGSFIAEAVIAAAERNSIDFAKYDQDKDGFVDNICVFYAGEDEAQTSPEHPDYLWSHSYNLLHSDYGKTLTYGGVQVNNYSCTAELFRRKTSDSYESVMAPIGTFCHEYLHNFGLPDFYDTDYEKSGGISAGFWGKTALMDGGNYNNNGNTPPNLNCVERECLGIMLPEDLQSGDYALLPVNHPDAKSYRIANPLDPDDYYLIEARSRVSWDLHIGLTEENPDGMLLYHVDRSAKHSSASDDFGDVTSADRWKIYNQVNARPDYQCADLIEADGRSDKDPSEGKRNDIAGIFFPGLGNTAIGGKAKIQLQFRDSTISKFAIQNIRVEDGQVRFTAVNTDSPLPPSPSEPPKDNEFLYIITQRTPAGSLLLSVNNSFGADVKWYFNDSEVAPDGTFRPEGAGVIRAEIFWSDGSVDYLYKNHSVKNLNEKPE